jgi:hypothetical protein
VANPATPVPGGPPLAFAPGGKTFAAGVADGAAWL